MRQRGAMHRGAPVRESPRARTRAVHGKPGRHGACARAPGRIGVRRHGRAPISIRGRCRWTRPPRRCATRSTWRAKRSSTAPSRWAIRTRCCEVADVKAAPVERLGRASSAIAAFHSAPTWGSCRSWTAATSACGCSSGAWARPWHAARVPAPPRPSGGGRGFWRRRYGRFARRHGPGIVAGSGRARLAHRPGGTVFTGIIDI